MENDKAVSKSEIESVLQSLAVHEGKFVMTNPRLAEKYARKFMEQCDRSWADPLTLVTFEIIGRLVRRALEEKILTEKDLFLTDSEVLDKLKASTNQEIQKDLKLLTPDLKIEINETDFDFDTRGKARYIDPPIFTNGKVKPLSEINPELAREITNFVARTKKGYKVKILARA
jgi:hypothetical protein